MPQQIQCRLQQTTERMMRSCTKVRELTYGIADVRCWDNTRVEEESKQLDDGV